MINFVIRLVSVIVRWCSHLFLPGLITSVIKIFLRPSSISGFIYRAPLGPFFSALLTSYQSKFAKYFTISLLVYLAFRFPMAITFFFLICIGFWRCLLYIRLFPFLFLYLVSTYTTMTDMLKGFTLRSTTTILSDIWEYQRKHYFPFPSNMSSNILFIFL